MYNPFSLENKTVLVTGASSGIGKAIAIECSKMGAKVIITARNPERLNETFSQLEGEGHISIIKDLSNTAQIFELIDEIPEIDCCANNAGIMTTLLTQFITEESLTETIKINTISPILLTQRLVKRKKIKRDGCIVFTASVAGVYCSDIGNGMYSTSKGAINGFMKNAALDLASKGIRVNSVNPAMVQTSIIDKSVISEEQFAEDVKRYPLKRYGRPEEVAHAVIYLFSDAAAWVTGTSLVIDGGYTL